MSSQKLQREGVFLSRNPQPLLFTRPGFHINSIPLLFVRTQWSKIGEKGKKPEKLIWPHSSKYFKLADFPNKTANFPGNTLIFPTLTSGQWRIYSGYLTCRVLFKFKYGPRMSLLVRWQLVEMYVNSLVYFLLFWVIFVLFYVIILKVI